MLHISVFLSYSALPPDGTRPRN